MKRKGCSGKQRRTFTFDKAAAALIAKSEGGGAWRGVRRVK
jgi:hypothetical protein